MKFMRSHSLDVGGWSQQGQILIVKFLFCVFSSETELIVVLFNLICPIAVFH